MYPDEPSEPKTTGESQNPAPGGSDRETGRPASAARRDHGAADDEVSSTEAHGAPRDRDNGPRNDPRSEFPRTDRVIPDTVRRLLELGLHRLGDRPDQMRQRLADLKLPKEAWAAILGQLDDRKSGLYRLVAKEVRDLLQNTNFAEDLVAALTKLSFEIKTEVRFVPNEAGSARPSMNSRVRVRNRSEGGVDEEEASQERNAAPGGTDRSGSKPPPQQS